MSEKFANVLSADDGTITTLSAAITTTDGTSITTAGTFPTALRSGTCRIRIGSELMIATVNSGGAVTSVTRGEEGSTAATHLSGAKVRHVLTAASLVAAQSGSGLPDATGATAGQTIVLGTDGDAESAEWADPSGGGTTKKVTHVLTGAGTVGTLATITSAVLRPMIVLPVATTRWWIEIANRAATTGAAEAGVLTFTAIYLGVPKFTGDGDWDGELVATPTQAITSFATPSNGSNMATAVCSDPALQFEPGVPMALDFGFTCSAATNLHRSNAGMNEWYMAGGSNTSSVGLAAVPSGTRTTANSFCDIRLVYETETSAPVVMFIGDSITERIVGSGDVAHPHQAWPGVAGIRNGFPWINLGVGGAVALDWDDTADWRWARADLATTVPDAAVFQSGYNDASNGKTLSEYKTAVMAAIDEIRSLGVTEIWVATTGPMGGLSDPQDVLRVSYNAWLRTLPYGIAGCIDHDLVLRDPTDSSSPFSALSFLVSSGPHPDRSGYQAMGAVVPAFAPRT